MSTVEDLRVYHVAREIVRTTWVVTRDLRHEGGISNQMRRAAVSIVSNIAEGHARRNDREFRNFLRYSRASCAELRAQADILRMVGNDAGELPERCDHCGRMLTKLIKHLTPKEPVM